MKPVIPKRQTAFIIFSCAGGFTKFGPHHLPPELDAGHGVANDVIDLVRFRGRDDEVKCAPFEHSKIQVDVGTGLNDDDIHGQRAALGNGEQRIPRRARGVRVCKQHVRRRGVVEEQRRLSDVGSEINGKSTRLEQSFEPGAPRRGFRRR